MGRTPPCVRDLHPSFPLSGLLAMTASNPPVHWLPSMVLMGMAGGLGWGIRGQYGHESGAMIAGVLVGCVAALLFARHFPSLRAARAAAFLALGVSVGGSMTYGQTLGLTQDAPLVGNWEALRWGYLGAAIKGGIWIGWGAMLLAVALTKVRYGAVELTCLLLSAVFLWFLGVYFLNEPFDPANRILPKIYFSDDWYWEPQADLQPRRESWGGLLVPLIGLLGYARIVRRDRLVFRLGLWGFVAGALGFANGQMLQAAHSWNPGWIAELFPLAGWKELVQSYEPFINWWNMMEISFGTIFGAVLGLGLWWNHALVDSSNESDAAPESSVGETSYQLPSGAEWGLVAIHLAALMTVNFIDFAPLDRFADMAITMIVIPVVAVHFGRWWPFLVLLPITLMPIAGKTVRYLGYQEATVAPQVAWTIYWVLPVLVALLVAVLLFRQRDNWRAPTFAAIALFVATWLYFALNFAFFHYPWPWQDWTGRTPSAIIMLVDAVGLTIGSVYYGRRP